MSDLLASAQTYAARNWHVLQVHPRAKNPVLTDWQERATTDEATVEAWWEEDYNVGVQMGPRSGIIDVECDSEEAEVRLAALLGPDFPPVPTFQGKRGKHRLFLWTPQLPFPDRAVFKWQGIEFRTGNGGKAAQSVFPPSVHPDGPVYQWLVPFEDAALVPFPEAALGQVRGTPTPPQPEGPPVNGMIPEHHRHEVFLSFAGHLRGQVGLPERTIYRMLAVLNEEHCLPLRPDKDIAKLAKSMGNYPTGLGLNPPKIALNGNGQAHANGDDPGIGLQRMTEIKPDAVDWLVPSYLPLGKMVLIAGDGGNGKSVITLHIAARLSRGLLPFQSVLMSHGEPVEVLLVNCEDDAKDTVVPRLMAAGADLSRMFWVEGTYGADGKLAPFNLSHYQQIEKCLKRNRRIKLVIIDPCSAYVGEVDDHRDAELRGLLGPLAELAMRTAVTFVLVKHLSKNVTLRAAHLVGGSVAWVNACRAAFAVAPDGERKDVRYFMPIKWNLGPPPGNLAYSFQPLNKEEYDLLLADCSHLSDARKEQLGQQLFRVSWDGPAEVDVDQVLTSSRQRQKTERKGTKKQEAADWVLEQLQAGPVPSKDLFAAAEEAGFSRHNLFDAKKLLGNLVKARNLGGDHWVWRLEESGLCKDTDRTDTSDRTDPFPDEG